MAEVPTPDIFKKWAGISAISSALERRVWLNLSGGKIYPNLFVFLVANPGVGKDQALIPARELLEESGTVNLAPTSMTGKGMIDTLADPKIMKEYTNPETKSKDFYQSLTICVPEFGTLLSKHDLEFLSIINDAYNCGPAIRERLRSQKEELVIRNPHICIVAGTQPQFISTLFPEEAWGMGFFARVIMVYHDRAIKTDLFGKNVFDNDASHVGLKKDLIRDLKKVNEMAGPMTVSEEAQVAINRWNLQDSEADQPMHPKLVHYNTRRILHLLKICMILAASQGTMNITLAHWEAALKIIYEAEDRMPEIFKEMSNNGSKQILDQAYYFILQMYNTTKKKPVPEHKVIQFLVAHVPAHQVHFTLETMLRSEIIKEWKDPKSIASYDTRASVKHARFFIPNGMQALDV
jgi:hypothetical protein